MNPQPLRVRVLYALELAPMTLDELARCLCTSRFSVEKKLSEFVRVGAIKSLAAGRGRNGHPVHVYRIAA